MNDVYRIRHEGWSRIFPEQDLSALSPYERELADRKAGEAWYAMRHMETVDLGYYLDEAYLEDGLRDGAPSLGRLAEYREDRHAALARAQGDLAAAYLLAIKERGDGNGID